MKKFLASFCFVALGLAAGLTMPRIVAQSSSPGAVQKWEQFCETPHKIRNKKWENRFPIINATMKKYGDQGYELVEVGEGAASVCFRRPVR